MAQGGSFALPGCRCRSNFSDLEGIFAFRQTTRSGLSFLNFHRPSQIHGRHHLHSFPSVQVLSVKRYVAVVYDHLCDLVPCSDQAAVHKIHRVILYRHIGRKYPRCPTTACSSSGVTFMDTISGRSLSGTPASRQLVFQLMRGIHRLVCGRRRGRRGRERCGRFYGRP